MLSLKQIEQIGNGQTLDTKTHQLSTAQIQNDKSNHYHFTIEAERQKDPPNTTRKLQKLDAGKTEAKKLRYGRSRMKRALDEPDIAYMDIPMFEILSAMRRLTKIWDHFSAPIIQNCRGTTTIGAAHGIV